MRSVFAAAVRQQVAGTPHGTTWGNSGGMAGTGSGVSPAGRHGRTRAALPPPGRGEECLPHGSSTQASSCQLQAAHMWGTTGPDQAGVLGPKCSFPRPCCMKPGGQVGLLSPMVPTEAGERAATMPPTHRPDSTGKLDTTCGPYFAHLGLKDPFSGVIHVASGWYRY